MAAKVIYCHIPQWYRELKDFLRADLQRFLIRADGERYYREEVDGAPLDRLFSLWRRLPYVRDAEELFSPEWSLGVEPLSSDELPRAVALDLPFPCGLCLRLTYISGRPKRAALLGAVPWLELLKDPETPITKLLARGWALFGCSNLERAQQVKRQTRSPVYCEVFGDWPAGSEAK